MLAAKCKTNRLNRGTKRRALKSRIQQLRLRRTQGRGHDYVAVAKSHLTACDTTNFLGNSFVDLVSDSKHAQFTVTGIAFSPEVDWLKGNFVQVAITEPPVCR